MNEIAVRALVNDVLVRCAPEEIFLLETYNPINQADGSTSKGPMGFGVDLNLALILPIVWKVCDEILKEVGKEVAKNWINHIKNEWKIRTSKKYHEKNETEVICEEIKARLVDAGLDKERIDEVALAIVAVLSDKKEG